MELWFLLTIIYKFKIRPPLALASHLSQKNKRESCVEKKNQLDATE